MSELISRLKATAIDVRKAAIGLSLFCLLAIAAWCLHSPRNTYGSLTTKQRDAQSKAAIEGASVSWQARVASQNIRVKCQRAVLAAKGVAEQAAASGRSP